MTKEIVILGASYAGLGVAHHLLKKILPSLPNKADYHVTLVDRSTKWFGRVGAPRGVVAESELALDKMFIDIEAGFKQYPAEQFAFQQGTAIGLDHAARTVTLQLADGTEKTIEYYALVIATGASPTSPLLGAVGSHEQSVEAITEFRNALPTAKHIVIAGGGPAGIETAGELGEYLNGKAGWFSSKPKVIKTEITVVCGDEKILPVLRPALATKAEKLLGKRGVTVLKGVKVVSTEPENAGKAGAVVGNATVTLSNGETKQADLYIPAVGTKPCSAWVPKDLLDERGRVDVNGKTLRVDRAGPRVYALGDVSNAGRGGILELLSIVPIAAANIKRDLEAGDVGEDKEAAKAPAGKDREFLRKDQESQLVPIGHGGGVGAFGGWKLPSFMVWAIKGRDYMSAQFPKTVDGRAW